MSERAPRNTPHPLDVLANYVPADQREAFFRRMAYLRKLPEEDEILYILEAMGLLTRLAVDAPAQVAVERTKLSETADGLRDSLSEFDAALQRRSEILDMKINEFSEDLVQTLAPETIAARVFEIIRQSFVRSALPQIPSEISAQANALHAANTSLARVVASITDPHSGAVANIERARREVDGALVYIARRTNATIAEAEKRHRQIFFAFLWLGAVAAIVLLFTLLPPIIRWLDSSH